MEMILLLALSIVGALGIGVVNGLVERKVEKVLDENDLRRAASWLLLIPVLEALMRLPERIDLSGAFARMQHFVGSSTRRAGQRVLQIVIGAALGYLLGLLLAWWLGWRFLSLAPYVLAVLGVLVLLSRAD
jgi:hypothetical protein